MPAFGPTGNSAREESKLRSPADMTGIRVDITNAWTKRCADCTRFCGHHEKPFFMDFKTFQKAIGSLQGGLWSAVAFASIPASTKWERAFP